MNKILLLISVDGSYIGGAQKRYLSLFNYLCEKRKDYYLVINKKLYLALIKNNVLKSYENVRVMTLYSERNIKLNNNLSNSKKENAILKDNIKKSGIRQYFGRKKMFLKSIVIWVTFILEFHKILKELGSKIVYAVWTGGMFAWPLKSLFKFKLIYSFNDSAMQMLDRNICELFNSSEYWVLKNANKIDFLSPAIVEMYNKKIGLIEKNKFSITPNSFINYKNYFSDSKKENDVIFLSRLWSNKNPILFLQSIKIFNNKYKDIPGINFYILGEGGLEADIINYITQYKLSNTKFVGKTLEPWKYLRKSKVFVSLQQINNYPSQSLIEAMACENAIIASDVGETRMLVTENEGILVGFNPESISEAIYKLLKNSLNIFIQLRIIIYEKTKRFHNINFKKKR